MSPLDRFANHPILWGVGLFWGLSIVGAGIPLGDTPRMIYGTAVILVALGASAVGGWRRSLRDGGNPFLGAIGRALAAGFIAMLPIVIVLVFIVLVFTQL